MKTRPRGFSSPCSLDGTPAYDLPSNSRKLQALNITLRRSTTPQTEYAKLTLSKEALLLRSGVTLRRHGRDSLSSLSSYASRTEREGEEGGRNSGEGTSDEEDSLEPINKSVATVTRPTGSMAFS